MTVADRIQLLKSRLPEGVRFVAVSKTQSPEQILEAYRAGHRIFGENKAQELVAKQKSLPDDIEWHFIGHLQTNKVAMVVPGTAVIQSIDSIRLLNVVSQEASKQGRTISCLLQIHIATEESKFGLSTEEAREILELNASSGFNHVVLSGLMGMATFTDDHAIVRGEFRRLRTLFESFQAEYFMDKTHFCECSMGMTSDYQIAVEEGATLIRIGTLIFGERNY